MIVQIGEKNSIHVLIVEFILFRKKSQIHGGFMTCLEMSGNGVRIYIVRTPIVITRVVTLYIREMAPTRWIVAVAGATVPGTVGQRIAATVRQAIAASAWAFALPGRLKLPFDIFTFCKMF